MSFVASVLFTFARVRRFLRAFASRASCGRASVPRFSFVFNATPRTLCMAFAPQSVGRSLVSFGSALPVPAVRWLSRARVSDFILVLGFASVLVLFSPGRFALLARATLALAFSASGRLVFGFRKQCVLKAKP